MPLLLNEAEVKSLLSMEDLIGAMERALVEFSARRVQQPVRTVLPVGNDKAFFGVMPAYVPSLPALGTKMVTVFAGNATRGLPTHLATISLLDPATGAIFALLDGRYITEARTAAVSAVSVRHLAKRGASRLAIIGTGVQARSHLEALARVLDLTGVRIWSRSAERRDGFVQEMQPHTRAPITAARDARDAVTDADVVVLVTASREPVVHGEWIRPGTHVCSVGACRPDQREMDTGLLRRARLFVDSRDAALVEAGDILLPIAEGAIAADHIAGELGEVVAGARQGRGSDQEVTIFKSLGMAVEDVAAAHLAVERARARGVGRMVEV